MKRFFRTLQSKIAAGYVVLMLLLTIVAIWSVTIISKMSSGMNQILIQNYNSVIASENMVEVLERHNSSHLLMLSNANEPKLIQAQIEKFEKDKEIFFEWFQRSSENMQHPREQDILDTLRQLYQRYLIDHTDFIKQIKKHDLSLARQFYLGWVLPKNNSMKEKCFHIFEINQGTMYKANDQTQQLANRAIVTIVALSIITLLFGIYASWKFTSFIVTPVKALTDTVIEIGRGNLNKVVKITSEDEVGQLGDEFNRMTERLRHFEALNIDRIITEKKKSESIVASITDPLIVIDAEKKIIHSNQAAFMLFDKSLPEVSNQNLIDVIAFPEITGKLNTLFSVASDEERSEEVSIKLEGRMLHYRIRYTPIQSRIGQLIGDVILFQDITRFKEIDRLKSDFIANVSHELRTPLTSIRMVIDLLLEETFAPLNSKHRSLLLTSRSDCDRLTNMVQELLDLSRLESGKIQLQKEIVNLRTLTQDVISAFQILIHEKNITVQIKSNESLSTVFVDAEQLRIVISNLLSNAIRFTDRNGSITFFLYQQDGFVHLEIEDTGKGIPKDQLPNVFDKFVQASGEITPGSVGLGLSIVKEIVEMHGGKTGVSSVFGKGSKFWCTIPIPSYREHKS